MSDPVQPDSGGAPDPDAEPVEAIAEYEIVDAYPVLADEHGLTATSSNGFPAIQAAAMAAGGFIAGATAMALAKRFAAGKLADAAVHEGASGAARIRGGEFSGGPAGSRTYLVSVRLISKSFN